MDEPGSWDRDFHSRCEALAFDIAAEATSSDERAAAWGELFRLLAPHLETWCRQSSTLRRAGLSSEDDWRATFLRVVERLVRRRYANLRAYAAQRAERLAAGDGAPTPFEGWLRQLVKFAAADEVNRCLATKRVQPGGGVKTMEEMAGAQRRPQTSMSSVLTAKRRSAAIRVALGTLDEEQKGALLQRVHGASYEEIAHALAASPEAAKNLVRSAKARLRRSLRQAQPHDVGRS